MKDRFETEIRIRRTNLTKFAPFNKFSTSIPILIILTEDFPTSEATNKLESAQIGSWLKFNSCLDIFWPDVAFQQDLFWSLFRREMKVLNIKSRHHSRWWPYPFLRLIVRDFRKITLCEQYVQQQEIRIFEGKTRFGFCLIFRQIKNDVTR